MDLSLNTLQWLICHKTKKTSGFRHVPTKSPEDRIHETQ